MLIDSDFAFEIVAPSRRPVPGTAAAAVETRRAVGSGTAGDHGEGSKPDFDAFGPA